MIGNIGRFLEKFKNIKPPEKFLKNEIILAIKDVSSVDLNEDDVEERGGTIYIKTKNSIEKNEIFLNTNKILENLNKKLGPRAPREIRF